MGVLAGIHRRKRVKIPAMPRGCQAVVINDWCIMPSKHTAGLANSKIPDQTSSIGESSRIEPDQTAQTE